MRKLNEICTDLKELLAEHFATVRVTSAQISEQFLLELKVISPAKLPAVVIVFEQSSFSSENTIRELRLSLVLINAFVAGSEERTLSVFEAYEKLLGILRRTVLHTTMCFICPPSVTPQARIRILRALP